MRWTQERLTHAWERHHWFPTMRELAAALTDEWDIVITEYAINNALAKYFPGHSFRETLGQKLKMQQHRERMALVSGGECEPRNAITPRPECDNKPPSLPPSDRHGQRIIRKPANTHVADVHTESKNPGDLILPLCGEWTTVVQMPDGHFPYHDPEAHEAAVLFAEAIRPHYVIHTGDDLDLEGASAYDLQSQHREKLKQTFTEAREFDAEKARRYKAAGVRRWVKELGNHEKRMHTWILKNCAALYDVIPPLEELVGWEEDGWDVVGYGYRAFVGRMCFKHGVKFNKHVAASEVEAHGSIAFGHTHRAQVIYRNTRDGYPEVGMTCGFLGKLGQRYEYHQPNDHVQGVGLVQVGAAGQTMATFHLITDGVLRYPLPGGRVLVCDGRMGEAREE